MPKTKRSDNVIWTAYLSSSLAISSPIVPVIPPLSSSSRRREKRDRLAVVDDLALGARAVIWPYHVRAHEIHFGRRGMLKLLAIGQNVLAGHLGRYMEALSDCRCAPISLRA